MIKKLAYLALGIFVGFCAFQMAAPAHAALSILTGQGGGTGFGTTTAGNIGNCLSVSSVSPLAYTFSGCAGGAGSSFPFTADLNFGALTNSTSTPVWFKVGLQASSTSQIAYASTTQVSAASLCLTGDICRTTWPAAGSPFPFTQQSQYGLNTSATTTLLQLTNGFTASSTSHLVDFDFRNATGTNLALSASSTVASALNVGGAFAANLSSIIASTTLTGKTLLTEATTTSFAALGSSTINRLNLTNALTITNGGTGAITLTGCLTGNGTGAITGSGTCNTSNATVSSIAAGLGLNGGTITTTGTLDLKSYVATSSAETAGNLSYWTSTAGTPATLGGVATGTVSAGNGITVTAGRSVLFGGLTITNIIGYPFLLNATSTTLTFSGGLVSVGSTTINGNATTTGSLTVLSSTTISSLSLTTALPNAQLANSSLTVNSVSIALGSSGTITAASSTLLTNANTFSGLNIFTGGLLVNNASTTIVGNATTTLNHYAGTLTIGSLSGLIGGNSGVTYAFASSSLFGYTPLNPTRALTINGTANQITSSAGSQDLSADRTWTLSLPQALQFPLAFTSTYGTTTYASSTSLTITNNAFFSTVAGSATYIGTTTPNFLAGMTIGTSTVMKFAQFAKAIASSTTSAAAYTVNWDTGNTQSYILNQNTSFIINSTSSNPRDGGYYALKVCQDPTGSRTATFVTPGQLAWLSTGTTTVSATANTATNILFRYSSTLSRYEALASSTSVDPRACQI